eukprot:scaffold133984_cov29-Tisochrysis_lutea.AAC.3
MASATSVTCISSRQSNKPGSTSCAATRVRGSSGEGGRAIPSEVLMASPPSMGSDCADTSSRPSTRFSESVCAPGPATGASPNRKMGRPCSVYTTDLGLDVWMA